MQPGRTPTLTSAWYGILAGLAVNRERRGFGWCQKWGVGARRRHLNNIIPPNVSPIDALRSPERAASIEAQREALAIFVAECRLCGGCPLGRE